jgi:pilus assembly protein CpaB
MNMNWKTWIPLVLAVVLGLVAMKVARDMTARSGAAPVADNGTRVAVLNKDLNPGTKLSAADVTLARVSAEVNPDTVFTDALKLEGRVLTAAGLKGMPVVQAMVAPDGTGSGLQAVIPDGMRALTIEINEFSGVAGNLTPGCRVDVVSTLTDKEGGEMLARTVVQNIKVEAMGMRRAPDADPNAPTRSVTLLATPKEAEAIELAYSTGRPRLVLRSSSDDAVATTAGVSVAELRRGSAVTSDPFASQVAMATPLANPQPVTPVELAPTTQPRSVEQTIRRQLRQIRIIRGGVESSVMVEEPARPISDHWMTDAGTEEFAGDGNE